MASRELPTTLRVFALIIGIDKYEHYKPHLRGAVKDANDFEYFLLSSLSVPKSRITKILDKKATKNRIVEEITSLGTNPDISRGDAIVIYFAGHGSKAEAPKGWKTFSSHEMVEVICPADMSLPGSADPVITAIPDIVLNILVTQLAQKKGDNITLIFDCCHSSNAIRGTHIVAGIRGIADPPSLSDDDVLLRVNDGSNRSLPPQSLDCSVLLAACGRDEMAEENSDGGLFTQGLLTVFRMSKSDHLSGLTYKELIASLEMPNRQNPQCDGSKAYRVLFTEKTADRAYIPGSKDKSGYYVLEVGQPQGIEPGADFDIYSNSALSAHNHFYGRLKVDTVTLKQSILTLPAGKSLVIPEQFFALHVTFGQEQKIKVYCSDTDKLNQIFSGHQGYFSNFASLVNSLEDAAISVSFEGCYVCLDWRDDNIIAKHVGSARIGYPVRSTSKEELMQVFRAVARFNFYLHLQGSTAVDDVVQLQLQRLEIREELIYGMLDEVRYPEGPNLLANDPAFVTGLNGSKMGPLGATILNFSWTELYPYIFWFGGRTLKIEQWYDGQHGVKSSAKNTDAPLNAFNGAEPGKLPVGYGEVNIKPWGFTFEEDGTYDVGFFKVFFATFPADFNSLAQISPFSRTPSPVRLSVHQKEPEYVDWWGCRTATIIQAPYRH